MNATETELACQKIEDWARGLLSANLEPKILKAIVSRVRELEDENTRLMNVVRKLTNSDYYNEAYTNKLRSILEAAHVLKPAKDH